MLACWPCGSASEVRSPHTGPQKLFGWFGGYGPSGTGQFMDLVGFAGDGKRNAILSGTAEFGGGTLLALGLATAPAGAAVTGNMVVAGSTHIRNGFFNTGGGTNCPQHTGWSARSWR